MNEIETKKEIAINEMFDANEKERTKQKDIMEQIGTLQATIKEKDTDLSVKKKTVDDFKADIKKLQSNMQ